MIITWLACTLAMIANGVAAERLEYAFVLAAPSSSQVRIYATDDSCTQDKNRVNAGFVEIRLSNASQFMYEVQVLRRELNNVGLTPLETSDADFAGGPGPVPPSQEQSATMVLTEGTYALICGTPENPRPDELILEVESAGRETTLATLPENPAAILEETSPDHYRIDIPDAITARPKTPVTLRIQNASQGPHELMLLWAPPGTTTTELLRYFDEIGELGENWLALIGSGELPLRPMGGMKALAAGTEGWIELHLEPGHYTAICSRKNPDGSRHIDRGMISQFQVVD